MEYIFEQRVFVRVWSLRIFVLGRSCEFWILVVKFQDGEYDVY